MTDTAPNLCGIIPPPSMPPSEETQNSLKKDFKKPSGTPGSWLLALAISLLPMIIEASPFIDIQKNPLVLENILAIFGKIELIYLCVCMAALSVYIRKGIMTWIEIFVLAVGLMLYGKFKYDVALGKNPLFYGYDPRLIIILFATFCAMVDFIGVIEYYLKLILARFYRYFQSFLTRKG